MAKRLDLSIETAGETMNNQNRTPGFFELCQLQTEILKPGYCRMTCPPQAEFMNFAGYYHGGFLFTLIDSAAGRAACCLNEGYRTLVTQSASIYYCRPCRDSSLRAEARCVHRGRTTALVTVEVFDDQDRLVSKGEVSCFYTGELSDQMPYKS